MNPFWLGKGLLLGALTTTVLACGPAGESGRTTAQTAPDPYLEEVAGTYRVEGVTVQSNRGELRDVSGTITLKSEGSGYTAEIALTTLYPTDVAAIPAEMKAPVTNVAFTTWKRRGRKEGLNIAAQMLVSTARPSSTAKPAGVCIQEFAASIQKAELSAAAKTIHTET